MLAPATLIQRPAPELCGGCSLIADGEASAASVQVGRGASTREQAWTRASFWPQRLTGRLMGETAIAAQQSFG